MSWFYPGKRFRIRLDGDRNVLSSMALCVFRKGWLCSFIPVLPSGRGAIRCFVNIVAEEDTERAGENIERAEEDSERMEEDTANVAEGITEAEKDIARVAEDNERVEADMEKAGSDIPEPANDITQPEENPERPANNAADLIYGMIFPLRLMSKQPIHRP
ncbi:hypothetical protein [Prolixibacter bellariivorans]|nr:hypothetical protein [Prolixibacter bellariivorans]